MALVRDDIWLGDVEAGHFCLTLVWYPPAIKHGIEESPICTRFSEQNLHL